MFKKWRIVFIIIGLLLLIRVSLPYAILSFANSTLKDIPEYSGKIKDINLQILLGKYQIKNIELTWLKGNEWVQIVSIESIEFKILWNKIFKGKMVASVNVIHPVLTIYERMVKPVRPRAKGKPITEIFRELSPSKIDLFTIKDGEFRYRNYYTDPNYVLYADSMYVAISNLTNMQNLSDPTYATMDLNGKVMGSGNLSMHLIFNPIQTPPNFNVEMKLLNLDVHSLNTFSRAYGGFDFEKGTLDLITEITMENKNTHGYVKPIFKDLTIYSYEKDVKKEKKDARKAFWEAIVGATSETLENQPRNQLATKIPISGNVEKPVADIPTAVLNVLRDAFIKAFMPTLEGNVKKPNK